MSSSETEVTAELPGYNSGFKSLPPGDQFLTVTDSWKPLRVFIYTSPRLIELLSFCREGHVDGTFCVTFL